MPIYEFRCPKCGHQFEELVLAQVSEAELICPKCLNKGMDKLMSVFSSSCGGSISSSSSSALEGASGCGATGSGLS